MSSNAWLALCGATLILIGVLLRWRTARYDLKDAAIDSAWTLARGKRTAENPTALETKLKDIQSQPTWTGKASKAAGTAIGHFVAQAMSMVGLILVLAGLVLVVAGYFWR